jgi:hypothetical protein
MSRVTLSARVDADGVLRVTVPLGIKEADREVRVTVEPAPVKKTMSQAEWAAWVDSKAGAWQGDFERPPQGQLQERGPTATSAIRLPAV